MKYLKNRLIVLMLMLMIPNAWTLADNCYLSDNHHPIQIKASQNSQDDLMPWNIEIHYRKQHEGNLDANYHCLGFGMNYSLSKWIDAGFFVNSGTYKYQMTVSSNNIILFDGDSRDFFWKYGFNTKLHPLSLLFPNFTSIDVYFDGYLGAFSYTSDYWPKTNKFLYGAGVGIALYPTRHFGLFYERAYDNVNKITINQSNKVKPMNRFGINVRFGGPKKWRK